MENHFGLVNQIFPNVLILFFPPAYGILFLFSGLAQRMVILGADQKDRSLWERDVLTRRQFIKTSGIVNEDVRVCYW